MVGMAEIRAFNDRLVRDYHPLRVVLFGSYARGTATDDSDVDLLVVMPYGGKAADVAVDIRLKLRPPFPLDLVVRRPDQIRERIAMGDSFLREVVASGTILYEAVDR